MKRASQRHSRQYCTILVNAPPKIMDHPPLLRTLLLLHTQSKYARIFSPNATFLKKNDIQSPYGE